MEILNVPEVARELRSSTSQIYRLIEQGHLKVVKLGTARKLVTREALDEFVRQGGVQDPSTRGAAGVSKPLTPAPAPAAPPEQRRRGRAS